MHGFAAVDFGFARDVLQRGVAALYVIAFVSTMNQFRPLLGEHGLLPVPALLSWARSAPHRSRMLRPTLFRYVPYTDRRLVVLCAVGIAAAGLLVVGVPQLGPPWVPALCFLALWLAYMSVVSVGQTFYGFGWEMLLLEAGFLAAFLGSASQPAPAAIIVLFWWLVFRLEFGAGMIKIRGGREWRDLTALTYHHQTQPMPGPLSRQAHLLPRSFHKLEVLANHVAQLVLPWLLFAPMLGWWLPGPVPAVIGAVAASVVILTQLWLIVTGNFAWLNWATVVLAVSAFGLPALGLGGTHPAPGTDGAGASLHGVGDGIPPYWLVVTSAVAVLYAVLSWWPARNLLARRQLMNASFNRWQLANTYGAFGTVTKVRVEYVVEGTRDADPSGARWVEYPFKGKPGDLTRVPRLFAPYHLRLDWLMWFLPLGQPLDEWFTTFLVRLLEADPPTLRLLAADPFDGARPRWVRVVSYRYRFTTRAEHRASGDVWVRDRRQLLVRPVSLPTG